MPGQGKGPSAASPADARTLAEWALEAGASSRTLARLLYALPRLAAGEPVVTIAAELGYDTPGAFAAMFRRYTGTTPS